MQKEMPRYCLMGQVRIDFPEFLKEEHPNLAKAKLKLNIWKTDLSDDVKEWKQKKFEEVFEERLQSAENLDNINEDYFPLSKEQAEEAEYAVVVYDRYGEDGEGESLGTLYQSDDLELPSQLVA